MYLLCLHQSYPEASSQVEEGERADVFGKEVHSDLWEKEPVKSKGGKLYYVTFIDDKTWLMHLYLYQNSECRSYGVTLKVECQRCGGGGVLGSAGAYYIGARMRPQLIGCVLTQELGCP